MGLLQKLLVKVVKAKWGSLLPTVFRAAAEGQFGEGIKKAYWLLAGKKTAIGAAILAVGAGLETVCSHFPADYAWSCEAGRVLYVIGGILASVGLVDGGTRAPWPEGAQAEHKE